MKGLERINLKEIHQLGFEASAAVKKVRDSWQRMAKENYVRVLKDELFAVEDEIARGPGEFDQIYELGQRRRELNKLLNEALDDMPRVAEG